MSDEIVIDTVRAFSGVDEASLKVKKMAWLRCPRIEESVAKIEKSHQIAGVMFKGNAIGFILAEKHPEKPAQ